MCVIMISLCVVSKNSLTVNYCMNLHINYHIFLYSSPRINQYAPSMDPVQSHIHVQQCILCSRFHEPAYSSIVDVNNKLWPLCRMHHDEVRIKIKNITTNCLYFLLCIDQLNSDIIQHIITKLVIKSIHH